MASIDTLLARLARRHQWQRVYDATAPRFAAAVVMSATVIASIRVAVPAGEWLIPSLAVAAVLSPLPWLPLAWRRREPPAQLAGELDLLAGAQGLAMAYIEQRDAVWSAASHAAVAGCHLPPFRLAGGIPALLALGLLVGAVVLPQVTPAPPPEKPAANLVRPVREDLAQLAAIGVLRPEERIELEKRLDDLLANAHGATLDQATWEGVDRLQAHLDAQATAAGEHLAAALATAQQGTVAPPANDVEATALAQTLAVQIAALAAQAPGLVPTNLQDPAAQEALANALAKAQAQGLLSKAQIAALQQAGLKLGKPGSCSAAQGRALARSLAQQLAQRQGGLGQGKAATAAQAFLAKLNGQVGQGGVTRGPGSSPITREQRARTTGGEDAGLAPGATLNPDGSVTIAAQARDAEPGEAARQDLQRAAAQAFDPAAADSRRATVAPRHREIVESYFRNDTAP